MAPKSAAALVLLAAMIAGLAPPLQAQIDPTAKVSFVHMVYNALCSGDDAIKTCASELVWFEGAISTDCCKALLKAANSAEGTRCACGFVKDAAAILGIDVDRSCQAASNGSVAGGPSKLKELCKGAPVN